MRFKSICKKGAFISSDASDSVMNHLTKGELYTIEHKIRFSGIFFDDYIVSYNDVVIIVFGGYTFENYFYTKSEMRNVKLNELLDEI